MDYTYDEVCAQIGLTRARLRWLIATMHAAGIAVGVQTGAGAKNIVFSEDDMRAIQTWLSTQSNARQWRQPTALLIDDDGYIVPVWS